MSSNLIINSLSTTTPLGSGESFTSPWVETSGYPAMTVACKTDVEGTLQVQFSPDMVNVDSTLSYQVDSTNEVHRVTLTRSYVREFGKAPKLRRPTSLGGGVELDDNIFGGLRVPEKSDVMLRCDYTSGNNLAVSGGYDLLLVKN